MQVPEGMKDDYYWRHRIHLDENHYTPGKKSGPLWDDFGLPESMEGKSFLDVGASDGMYCFNAERRGADTVVAADIWDEYADEDWEKTKTSKDTFNLAKDYLQSDVDSVQMDIMDVSPKSLGTFDVVLCSWVLQVVPDIYTAVRNLATVTDELLVVRVVTTTKAGGFPAIEYWNHPNRTWLPNTQFFQTILGEEGASETEYWPLTETNQDSRLPPTASGKTTTSTILFADAECTQPIKELSQGEKVQIHHEEAELFRIEHLEGPVGSDPPTHQGWVPKSTVTVSEDSLLRDALDVLVEDGVWGLGVRATKTFLPQFQSRRDTVVHGTFSI